MIENLKPNDDFIMLPTVDFCFKGLMDNAKVRRGFVAALLHRHPDEIKETILLPTELSRESADDKLGILDVRVLLNDGTQLDMEMQVTYYEYWDERVIFYLTKMYAGQIKRGDSYEKLKKCIHVSILDFIHFPEDDTCYRTICLCDKKTGKKYTDLLEIQVLELPKICGAKKGDSETAVANEIIKWMRFLGGKKREEFRKMAETDEYLSEAYEELKKLSADDKKRFEYEARERAILDYNSHMEGAEKKGFKQGFSRGKNEKLKEQVQKKLLKGKSVEAIADELEEDVSVIRELIDSLEI